MANSIFVSRDDTFELTVYYTKEGDFAVKKSDQLTDEEKESEYSSVTIKFSVPDHASAKVMMRRSTSMVGGMSNFDNSMFNNMMFELLAKSWDLKDDNGKAINFEAAKLNEMRPDIVRAFVELLQEKLDEQGLYEAILMS